MIRGANEPVAVEALVSIGQVTEHNGQRYVYLGAEPYVNRRGEEIDLYRLSSKCCDCGSSFTIKIVPSTRYWNMRCPPCIRGKRGAR